MANLFARTSRNVNRLYNKLDSVRELLLETSLDILSISESWLTPNVLDSEVYIDGYSAVRKDRNSTQIIVYIRNGINYTMRSDLMSDGVESVWIQVNRQKCKTLVVGSFYRAPDENIDLFVERLNRSLGLLNLDCIEIAILMVILMSIFYRSHP